MGLLPAIKYARPFPSPGAGQTPRKTGQTPLPPGHDSQVSTYSTVGTWMSTANRPRQPIKYSSEAWGFANTPRLT